MDPRKAMLLEMKRAAGLATPAEVEAMDNATLYIGEGLAVKRPCRDPEQWVQRCAAWTCSGLFIPQPMSETPSDDSGCSS